MSYVTFWSKLFCLNRDVYQPVARDLCFMIMPCILWWAENYLEKPANDNCRVFLRR